MAKRGVTNAVLLEKDALTAGTTWHTAGLVWRLRPNDVEIQLLSHMVNLVNSLEEETGVNPGWINNGGIFIANNKERLDEYQVDAPSQHGVFALAQASSEGRRRAFAIMSKLFKKKSDGEHLGNSSARPRR